MVIVSILLNFGSIKLFGQNDINLPIKKVKSKDWSPILDETLSRWEVWTGHPKSSVKNLPPNYEQDERGKKLSRA